LSLLERAALLLIDIQQAFDDPHWGQRNQPMLEVNVARLIQAWRSVKGNLVHVQHSSTEAESPLRPDQPGFQFKPEAMPLEGEPVFVKHVNSAFIGTKLESFLRQGNIERLLVCGLTTDHCVSTSVRMAANLGFEVGLIEDAVATFDRRGHCGTYYDADQIHRIHLASLNGEFCRIIDTEIALAEITS